MELSGLFCEVEVCGGEGGEEMEVEEGFLNDSGAWSVAGDFDVDGCGCGTSVGLPSLVVLVPKTRSDTVNPLINLPEVLETFLGVF